MPTRKLTAQGLKSLTAVDERRTEYFDEELPGFCVRVSPSGGKSFSVLYRRGRRLRRYTLGKYPVLGLAQARALARKALAEAALGGDPGGWKIDERRAATFTELATDFLDRYARPNKRSWREDERRIRKSLLPFLGPKPAAAIRRAEFRAALEQIVDRGAGIEANRTHALLRTMYRWGLSMDLVERNPTDGLIRPVRERARFRILRVDEIRRLWAALEDERALARAALRLMLLTAQRGGEVLSMRHEDVELGIAVWTIPADVSKNELPHRVPLSGPALAILDELARLAGDSPWLFPSKRTRGHWSGIQKAIQRIRRRTGIDFRGHDLRRTAASTMTSLGIPRLVVGKVLNHVEPGVTAVYDRHSYDREKRDALERWAEHLELILLLRRRNT
jgi:integrase